MNNPIIGGHIIELKQTASTNLYTDKLLHSQKPEEGTVIIAYKQTKGKGQDQNSWESAANKNLTFSIVLYPEFLNPSEQFRLIEVTSLGIADYISNILPSGHKVRIKWPNDIYVGDRKLCGTLVQNSIVGSKLTECIAGIGLNVNQVKFLSDAPNPVSLKQITGVSYNLFQELKALCSCIDKRYFQLKNKQYNQLENDYLSLLYRINEMHDFIIHDEKVRAQIIGITNFGQLKLESTEQNIYECGMKEVAYCL